MVPRPAVLNILDGRPPMVINMSGQIRTKKSLWSPLRVARWFASRKAQGILMPANVGFIGMSLRVIIEVTVKTTTHDYFSLY